MDDFIGELLDEIAALKARIAELESNAAKPSDTLNIRSGSIAIAC